MDPAQKVRTLRRLADRLAHEQAMLDEDLGAFGAPEECYADVARSERRRVQQLFDRVGLSRAEFAAAMEPIITREALALDTILAGQPPRAFDEYSMLMQGMPDRVECHACRRDAGLPMEQAPKREVVDLGPVVNRADPTQTYVLKCGHTAI